MVFLWLLGYTLSIKYPILCFYVAMRICAYEPMRISAYVPMSLCAYVPMLNAIKHYCAMVS